MIEFIYLGFIYYLHSYSNCKSPQLNVCNIPFNKISYIIFVQIKTPSQLKD